MTHARDVAVKVCEAQINTHEADRGYGAEMCIAAIKEALK